MNATTDSIQPTSITGPKGKTTVGSLHASLEQRRVQKRSCDDVTLREAYVYLRDPWRGGWRALEELHAPASGAR